MERSHRCGRLVSWAAGRRLGQRRGRLVVLLQAHERPVVPAQRHRFSDCESSSRARAIDVCHGVGWACLGRLENGSTSPGTGLTQRHTSHSNARGAGRHHGPAPLGVFTAILNLLVRSGQKATSRGLLLSWRARVLSVPFLTVSRAPTGVYSCIRSCRGVRLPPYAPSNCRFISQQIPRSNCCEINSGPAPS